MNKEDLGRIISILGRDEKYLHFGKRVSKDFEDSLNKGMPVAMQVFFARDGGEDVGFVVISISPLKMKEWERVFIEEGWVLENFKTGIASFELMYLYIKEEFRKKRFGSGLFRRVVSYARKTGIKSIYAYVSDSGDQALKFYIKEGGKVINNFSEEGNTTAFLVWEI